MKINWEKTIKLEKTIKEKVIMNNTLKYSKQKIQTQNRNKK